MKATLLAAALAALSSAAVEAAILTVTSNNDSGPGSLRAAVAASAAGDTITFAANVVGKIVLTSGQIQIQHALTITGPGWRQLQIEGNYNDRIFHILDAAPASCPAPTGAVDYVVTISGLGLGSAARDGQGGAIRSLHSLNLDSVVIYDSAARAGGGIAYQMQYAGQSLSITNSVLVGNSAKPLSADASSMRGGGLFVFDYFVGCGNANLTRFAPAPTVTIANTVLAGNRAQPLAGSGLPGSGGAIFARAYADITFTDSRIVDNHLDVANPDPGLFYNGGAFYGYAKSLTFVRSEISDNSVSAAGVLSFGGAFVVSNNDSTLQAPADAMAFKLIDSTVSGNTANNLAGISVSCNVALELDNATVNNNTNPLGTGSGFTGAIFVGNSKSNDGVTDCTPPTLTMASSIVANSGAAPRLDLATQTAAPGLASFTVTANNSLIETICPFCNITVSGSNNLPQGTDPMLGPLAYNGGLTRTQPPLPGSPVIDAGSNPLPLTADQRGSPRVVGSAADMGAFESVVIPARLLVPDGTSVKQTFGAYPDTKWFALGVEPGKTYAIEVADVDGDLTANAIGTLGLYDVDGVSAPPEASIDCTAANGRRPPAVDVNVDGVRCILRTAPAAFATFLNKRPVYVKATRMDPATGGGSQFKIRAREATIYGRWLTAGYDYHVEVENTTGDAMCVEIARYPATGLSYDPYTGWGTLIGIATLTVPAFGAVKTVTPMGSNLNGDTEGTFRIGACPSPVNLIPGALHVSSFAFDTLANRFVYFFTTTANEGKTRSTW